MNVLRSRSLLVDRMVYLTSAGALWVWCAACSATIDPAAIADAQLAVRVKTALVNDPDLGPQAIEVTVSRGSVTLSGRVASVQHAEHAVRLSRAVDGVIDVHSRLEIGGANLPVASDDPPRAEPSARDAGAAPEGELLRRAPLVLAVGAAVGWSDPRAGALLSRVAISPIFKVGWTRGFGPAVGFGWFQADVHSAAAQPEVLSRVHVKPIMAGIGYTFTSGRVSVSPSIIGGVAFNSLTITDTGAAAGVAVEVDNSFAWRPGLSVWFDAGRVAFNVSSGYLLTDLRITVLEGGRLVKRDARGDTTLVHVGVAYKLF
jgi:hypothetical protein